MWIGRIRIEIGSHHSIVGDVWRRRVPGLPDPVVYQERVMARCPGIELGLANGRMLREARHSWSHQQTARVFPLKAGGEGRQEIAKRVEVSGRIIRS